MLTIHNKKRVPKPKYPGRPCLFMIVMLMTISTVSAVPVDDPTHMSLSLDQLLTFLLVLMFLSYHVDSRIGNQNLFFIAVFFVVYCIGAITLGEPALNLIIVAVLYSMIALYNTEKKKRIE